jgi:hypothetical protein
MVERKAAPFSSSPDVESRDGRPLRILTAAQIRKIDRMLAEIGSFGEVRLIKSKGRVCILQKVESENIIQPHTGSQKPTE